MYNDKKKLKMQESKLVSSRDKLTDHLLTYKSCISEALKPKNQNLAPIKRLRELNRTYKLPFENTVIPAEIEINLEKVNQELTQIRLKLVKLRKEIRDSTLTSS